MSDLPDRMLRVEERVSETRGVLLGIEGQGGLIQRLEQVAERTHKLASDVAVVQAGLQLQAEDIKDIIAYVKDGHRT